MGSDSPAPTQVQGEQEFGIRWDGEYEALSRLIFGLGTKFEEAAAKGGLSREQAADLRKNSVLFTQTERPGLGPGYAMDVFAERAKGSGQDAEVAALLAGPTFAKARYAWTSAWPTLPSGCDMRIRSVAERAFL